MRNILIGILVIVVIVLGYFAIESKLKLDLGEMGKTAKIIRGDLTLPINATGEVRPTRRVVIKAEASGEVIEIFKQGGERVEKDERLILLDKEEEQRSVTRAEQDQRIAEARLEDARINLQLAQTADLDNAKAQVAQLEASLDAARFRKEHLENVGPAARDPLELYLVGTNYRSAEGQLAAAQANLERAKLAIPLAQQVVKQAEATFETAKENLADANRRLRKTTIVAPIEGVLAIVRTQVGEVIQGGKTTLTGGTELAVILDDSKIIVRAEVDEADIGRVLAIAPQWAQPGNDGSVAPPEDFRAAAAAMENPPKITVEAYSDKEFIGVIERIYPEPKTISNVVTYQVDVVVVSEDKSDLLSGMRADVEFTSEHVSNVLLCPDEAVREGPNSRLGVYVPPKGTKDPEAEPEFIECQFGLSNGAFSEVRGGLDEGAVVYTKMPRKVGKKDEKKRRR